MPDWMIYSGYVLFALSAFCGLLILVVLAFMFSSGPSDPFDKFGYPIIGFVAVCFLFAAFWIFRTIHTEHPWQDSLQYCVRIGSDNEAVFLGGQAEKYSMEYRLLKRAAKKHPKWLQEDTEVP